MDHCIYGHPCCILLVLLYFTWGSGCSNYTGHMHKLHTKNHETFPSMILDFGDLIIQTTTEGLTEIHLKNRTFEVVPGSVFLPIYSQLTLDGPLIEFNCYI